MTTSWAMEGVIGTGDLPEGAVEISHAQRKQAIAAMTEGKLVTVAGGVFAVTDPPEPEPQPEPEPLPPTQQDYSDAIQAHIDATAQSRGYRDGFALAGYMSSTVSLWAGEAQTFVAWRDQVWVYAYTELAKVQGGQRDQPEISVLVDELPAIAWP